MKNNEFERQIAEEGAKQVAQQEQLDQIQATLFAKPAVGTKRVSLFDKVTTTASTSTQPVAGGVQRLGLAPQGGANDAQLVGALRSQLLKLQAEFKALQAGQSTATAPSKDAAELKELQEFKERYKKLDKQALGYRGERETLKVTVASLEVALKKQEVALKANDDKIEALGGYVAGVESRLTETDDQLVVVRAKNVNMELELEEFRAKVEQGLDRYATLQTERDELASKVSARALEERKEAEAKAPALAAERQKELEDLKNQLEDRNKQLAVAKGIFAYYKAEVEGTPEFQTLKEELERSEAAKAAADREQEQKYSRIAQENEALKAQNLGYANTVGEQGRVINRLTREQEQARKEYAEKAKAYAERTKTLQEQHATALKNKDALIQRLKGPAFATTAVAAAPQEGGTASLAEFIALQEQVSALTEQNAALQDRNSDLEVTVQGKEVQIASIAEFVQQQIDASQDITQTDRYKEIAQAAQVQRQRIAGLEEAVKVIPGLEAALAAEKEAHQESQQRIGQQSELIGAINVTSGRATQMALDLSKTIEEQKETFLGYIAHLFSGVGQSVTAEAIEADIVAHLQEKNDPERARKEEEALRKMLADMGVDYIASPVGKAVEQDGRTPVNSAPSTPRTDRTPLGTPLGDRTPLSRTPSPGVRSVSDDITGAVRTPLSAEKGGARTPL